MPDSQNSILLKISKFISDFFNPLTSFFIYYLYFSIKNFTAKEAFSRFLPILLIMIVPIIGWIAWNVKKGKYTNMDVSNRNQRKSLYFFIAGVIAIYLLYDYFANGTIDLVMFFTTVLLVLMQISNYFIKSSMHTAFNVFVAALFFVQDLTMGMVWLCISILVGITRIILKRHTPKEVLSGFCIAALVSFMYIYVVINN